MGNNIFTMKLNVYIKKIVFLFIFIFIFFNFSLIAFAEQTCSQRYPINGKCVEKCEDGYTEDQGVGLCKEEKDKCCHEYAATQSLKLQIPLLTYTDANNIYEYIGNIYSVALYILVPIAILVIIYAGIQWASSGGAQERIKASKVLLFRAFLGLGLAIFSYTLLSVVGITTISLSDVTYISPIVEIPPLEFFDAIGGEVSLDLGSGDYQAMAVQASKDVGVSPCVGKTILAMESGGKPNAIGHDENARISGVKARRNFVKSGKKYSGATFAPTGIKTKVFNDDKTICAKEDLCLDWRFSHGIGLGQLTIFPGNFCTNVPSRKFSGKCLTAKELLHPQGNLEGSLRLWKANFKGSDYRTAFRKYNGSGSAAEKYATKAMKIFNACTP